MKGLATGGWLGVLGAGQLGMMLAVVARRCGFRTIVWSGGGEAVAEKAADMVVRGGFDDPAALEEFLAVAQLATVEFENIPLETLQAVEARVGLYPSARAVAICQHREREKEFLREHGIPHAPFRVVGDAASLAVGMAELGGAAVLKTASFGYDGKGQRKLEGHEDAARVWEEFGMERAVLEKWIPFELELSVMVARGARGEVVTYDPAENRHRHHMLDVSIVPARISAEVAEAARGIAVRVAEALDYRGILGVEFFLTRDGGLMVNEMAPRPHNSGHHTLDACATSQFEQQLRAVCGLPLGSTRLLSPVAMLNLLGDFWPAETRMPDWSELWADPEAFLHLYGKERAVGRRKMGHVNLLGADVGDALARAERLKGIWLGESKV
jgi:5-(carboxyamino)imidazole ribonucleotide synthase